MDITLTQYRVHLAMAVIFSLIIFSCQLLKNELGEQSFYKARDISQPEEYGPQCHASTIIELPNGDLLTAWWSGSYEGATDVVIKAARLPFGADSWGKAETVADIPNRFEGTPVLFLLPDLRVWLLFAVIAPETPKKVQIMFRESKDHGNTWGPIQEFLTPPGIRNRNRPILMKNEDILFPLFDQITLRTSIFLILNKDGQSWELSQPVISDAQNVEPAVIQRKDGELYALMRTWSEKPTKRFLGQSVSTDYGRTWSALTYSRLPTVNSSVEMLTLKNGHVVLAFHDGKEMKRTPLNLALSSDEGETWPYNRIMEEGEGSFSYPSLVQSRNGHIHVTYSYNRKLIKHVEVNEAWIKAGEVSAR